MSFQNSNGHTGMKLRLFKTKTDRSNEGCQLTIGETGTEVCAISAMCRYLRFRTFSKPFEPLFIFRDGVPLRRKALISFIRVFLEMINEPSERYAGHSFRIGGASDLAAGHAPVLIHRGGHRSRSIPVSIDRV